MSLHQTCIIWRSFSAVMRLAAAVSLASASGDVRLAMLICQVIPRLIVNCNACSYLLTDLADTTSVACQRLTCAL